MPTDTHPDPPVAPNTPAPNTSGQDAPAATHALPKSELRPFLQKADAPGLVRLSVQFVWLAASATVVLWAAGQPGVGFQVASWAGVVALGACITTFFPPLHEAGHQTAFRTRALNTLTLWWCALLMLESPTFFQEFHWAHHRHTQDRDKDPEIAAAPDVLDAFPTNPLHYLGLASGQMLLFGKPMLTLAGVFVPFLPAAQRFLSYVRPAKRGRVAAESVVVIGVWAALIWLGVQHVPGFERVLLAWPVSHVFLGLYLMAEHTGLGHTGSFAARTRTVTSNSAVRFFMWNMPLHTVHHVHPAVPFHHVPAVHARLMDGPEPLPNVVKSYTAFHKQALAHAFGRGAA